MAGETIKIELNALKNSIEEAIISDLNTYKSDYLQSIYPIGSVYITVKNVDPSTFLCGQWERIAKGRTLVGVDETSNIEDLKSSGAEFGEAEHTLTVEELPKHNHSVFSGYEGESNGGQTDALIYRQIHKQEEGYAGGAMYRGRGKGDMQFIGDTGSGLPHSNYQPSYTCYIWERVS